MPIKAMKTKDVERKLRNMGFTFVKQEGSHRRWVNDAGKVVITLDRQGRDVSPRSIKIILASAGIPHGRFENA